MSENNTLSFSMKDQKCESVVVFLDRAEVSRLLKTKLNKGENELIITSISQWIDEDSVRIEGSGEASVLDVVCQSKRVESKNANHDKEIEELRKEIKSLESLRDKLTTKRSRFNKQKDTLNQFATSLSQPGEKAQSPGSKENVDSFLNFLDSYTNKLETIDEELSKLVEEENENNEKLSVLYDKLDKFQIVDYNTSKELKILIESKAADTEISLKISYIVYNASWSPKYDIRVFGKDKKMIINYFGMIRQTTGEDWTDSKISLSTAVPSAGGNVPELNTENARIKPKIQPRYFMKNSMPMLSKKSIKGYSEECQAYSEECQDYSLENFRAPVAMAVMQADVQTSGIGSTSTFEIPRVASIPSDNENHKVSIAIINLDPEIEYETVPKKTTHAFIKAKVVNNSSYALLAGPANVFLDNNFIAKTDLKSYSPNEEFECSLGVDPAIRVTYKPIKKYKTQTGLMKNYSLTTYEQVIVVKNTTQNAAKILLKDSIPLSNDDKIQIKIVEPDTKKKDSKFNLTKLNILECNLILAANKSEDLIIKYTIEHPDGEEIEFF